MFADLGPLQRAAHDGDLAEVKRLLAAGTPVNARCGHNDWTALHAAIDAGQVAVAEFLIDYGADVNTTTAAGSTPLDLTGRDDGGKPYSKSSEDARNAIAEHLLEHGADPNAAEPNWRITPLMIAASADDADLVKILLQHGANPTLKNYQGYTALDYASHWNDPRLSSELSR